MEYRTNILYYRFYASYSTNIIKKTMELSCIKYKWINSMDNSPLNNIMKFRTGKYAGLTVEHVKKIAPWYIQWVRENRPEMLRDRSPKPQLKPYKKPVYVDPPDIPKEGAIQPNYDFDNMF